MKLKHITVLAVLALGLGVSHTVLAQAPPVNQAATAKEVQVEVIGVGLDRNQAINDGLRSAVSQAMGVAVKSTTTVENFVTIEDAILTNTQGYISNYKVLNETKFPDRFEVKISAVVSSQALKADVNLLSKAIGGIRFMVVGQPMTKPSFKGSADLQRAAISEFNRYFAQKKIRYVEQSRAEQIAKDNANLYTEDKDVNEVGYAQQLGMKADAQFVIMLREPKVVSESFNFGTSNRSTAIIEAVAYDNCTGEGLGTFRLHGLSREADDAEASSEEAIRRAVATQADTVLDLFNGYIAKWVNEGTPFELRFMDMGGYSNMTSIRRELRKDPNFGGEMEITAATDFMKLNCTFKKKPDELADRVLELVQASPQFKGSPVDVKYIFGRQITFQPATIGQPVPAANQQPAVAPRNTAQPSTKTTKRRRR